MLTGKIVPAVLAFAACASFPVDYNKRGLADCLNPQHAIQLAQTLKGDVPQIAGNVTDLSSKLGSLTTKLEGVTSGDVAQLLSPSVLNSVEGVAKDITDLGEIVVDLNDNIEWSCIGGDLLQNIVDQFDSVAKELDSYVENVDSIVNDLTNLNPVQGAFDLLKDLYQPNQALLGILKKAQGLIPGIGGTLANVTTEVENCSTKIHDLLEKIPF